MSSVSKLLYTYSFSFFLSLSSSLKIDIYREIERVRAFRSGKPVEIIKSFTGMALALVQETGIHWREYIGAMLYSEELCLEYPSKIAIIEKSIIRT